MEIYVEGQMVEKLPCLTREEKLRRLNEMCVRFAGTWLYPFWRDAYIRFRDGKKANKKAGKHAGTRNPADNGNHDDGKPAA